MPDSDAWRAVVAGSLDAVHRVVAIMKTADSGEKQAILDGLIDLFGQNRRWVLFFGTGTSCALDKRFGMPALADHLKKEVVGDPDWSEVERRLADGDSLERALTAIVLQPATKTKVQKITGDFVAGVDRSVRTDLLLGNKRWVGERLLKALTQRLPPRTPRLQVVTANYDMLIEYSCAFQGIRCATGFLGEIVRRWNWEGVQDSLNQCRVSREGARNMVITIPVPRVELLKVHGSINRFNSADGQIECDLWTNRAPAGYERVIAAPGDQKYEQYADAGNIATAALGKAAQSEAMAFAVIGYGFKDKHLHDPTLQRVRQQDCPLLVMTRDLDDAEIAKLRKSGNRVWVLVAPKVAGGGNDDTRTLVFMPGHADPLVLDGERLWSCDAFAEKILGG